jgi:hypothetical protein
VGVTPPETPARWFFDRLCRQQPSTSVDLLDGPSNELAKVTRHDPKREILASCPAGGKRHDRPRLGDVPTPGARSANESTKDKELEPSAGAC